MNFISQLLLALIFASPAAAHHGPYSKNTDGSTHELHLGKVQTLSPRGQVVLYGVRAVSLSELIFDKPWFGCGLVSCGEPFALPTSQIISFGPTSFDIKSDSTGKALATGATAVFAPLLLIPLGIAEGQTNLTYQISYIDGSGRLIARAIRLYSEGDSGHLGAFLSHATGRLVGEVPASKILTAIRQNLLNSAEKKFIDIQSRLTSPDPKRPWCSHPTQAQLDTNQDYLEALINLNLIRQSLGLEDITSSGLAFSDSRYKEYLLQNPQIAAWASANPEAAVLHKRCPDASDKQTGHTVRGG